MENVTNRAPEVSFACLLTFALVSSKQLRSMKTIWTIIISLAIVWSCAIESCPGPEQFGGALSVECCAGCACAPVCCLGSSQAEPQPPAQHTSRSIFKAQLAQADCRASLHLLSLEQREICWPAACEPPVEAPLYIRHCAYLI
jgi:hypothetical protein